MPAPVAIYFLGTAGCGKSSLTAAMAGWLSENQYPFQTVNLDPGADSLPYEPDIDVRDWVTLSEVMKEYGLGPNGAQIVAADMVALNKGKLFNGLSTEPGSYLLLDTPGQMELFAFREASRELVRGLQPKTSFLVYLIDPFNSRTPSGFVSQLMLSSLCRLRFQMPSLEVLSKADMVPVELNERIGGWLDYPGSLLESCQEESSEAGDMGAELNIGIFRALDDLGLFSKLFPVSSKTGEGIEHIYRAVQLTYGGGEDLKKEGY